MKSSKNLTQFIGTTKDYIHLGKNCSATKGCNNVSPSKPETDFVITNLPAQIIIKLWKNKPENKTSPADNYVNILITAKE